MPAYKATTKRKRDSDVEELEEEEYEVESIRNHRVRNKVLQYLIKWKGYDSDENTWEPEDAVSADEILAQYWKDKGGKDGPAMSKSKKPGRHAPKKRASSVQRSTPDPQNTKRSRTLSKKTDVDSDKESLSNETATENIIYDETTDYDVIKDTNFRMDSSWDWPTAVKEIETVVKEPENDPNGSIYAVLRWNDGVLSMCPTTVIRDKCPQKLIGFYEQRLKFESVAR
ncbi:uncharacterized protein BYT42DRAFT_559839 [Radiomyces spectabilis]|uniref:uncharacterized protein n=1 Tax=Radiomyces spectabilis TaxID=64574 RepID=UPI00221F91C6|nr:uncharacterized protein BYT42DRAFT_559839 [Radiomyces spectabilis]KAI8388359.1 hypothetical protein BYT42DRAFT_559839 [Radiomyces spectabilis]